MIGEPCAIGQIGEMHKPDGALPPSDEPLAGSERQARLSNSTGSTKRDQPRGRVAKHSVEPRQLLLPTEESGVLRRQVVCVGPYRMQRSELPLRHSRKTDLKQAIG